MPRPVGHSHEFEQAVVVEPGYPSQGCQFHRFAGLPGCPPVDRIRLVKAVDGFGHRVVALSELNDLDPGHLPVGGSTADAAD